jgi:uncharacterized membrane protein
MINKSYNKNLAERPKIRPEKEPFDLILEVAGLIAVVIMVVFTAVKFPQLPETIPTHFNAAGEPDGFGSRMTIWLLPSISVIMFAGLYALTLVPWIWNYPVNITPENAQRLYSHGTRSMRLLSLVLVLMFLYISWMSVQSALHKSGGLGAWFLPVTLVSVGGVSIYMVVNMYRLK